MPYEFPARIVFNGVPIVPVAFSVRFTVGRVATEPAAKGPGTVRVTTPPACVTDGVPDPTFDPPESVADTKLEPAGTGILTFT